MQQASATMHGNHSEETRRSNSTRIDLFIECKESSELNWNIELKLRAWNIKLKLRATATAPGQGVYRKGKRRSDSIRNNKFIECNDPPELNWSIELNLKRLLQLRARNKCQIKIFGFNT